MFTTMSSQGEVKNRPSKETVFKIQSRPAGKASVGMCCGTLSCLQHKYEEVKEALEFSEIERAAIAEANTELESQINTLTAQVEERTKSLEHTQ